MRPSGHEIVAEVPLAISCHAVDVVLHDGGKRGRDAVLNRKRGCNLGLGLGISLVAGRFQNLAVVNPAVREVICGLHRAAVL